MNIFKTWKQPTVYKEMDNILQKGTVSNATRPMLTVNKPRPGVMGDLGIDPLKTGLPLLETMHELMPPEGLKVYDKMRKNDPVVGGLVLLLSATLCYAISTTTVKSKLMEVSSTILSAS